MTDFALHERKIQELLVLIKDKLNNNGPKTLCMFLLFKAEREKPQPKWQQNS